jgi:hypothetical protein
MIACLDRRERHHRFIPPGSSTSSYIQGHKGYRFCFGSMSAAPMEVSSLAAEFSLRAELAGHDADVTMLCLSVLVCADCGALQVRGLCPMENDMFASASRDHSVRIWAPAKGGAGFEVSQILYGHDHFVAAVAYLPATATTPGMLVSGRVPSFYFCSILRYRGLTRIRKAATTSRSLSGTWRLQLLKRSLRTTRMLCPPSALRLAGT